MELRDYQKRVTTGERIKEKRKELGITAEELGEKVGVNRSTIYRYEKGDIEKLPISVIEAVAKVLRTSVSYLLGTSDRHKNVSASWLVGFERSEKESRLLKAYNEHPEMQHAIDTLLGLQIPEN